MSTETPDSQTPDSPTSDSETPDGDARVVPDSAGSPAAPRRRRATKASGAGAPAVDPATAPPGQVAADDPVDAGTETEGAVAPAKRAPRKAAKKAAPRKRATKASAAAAAATDLTGTDAAVADELEHPEPVVVAVEDAPGVAEAAAATAPSETPPTEAAPDDPAGPAKRTRTRRPAAAVSFQPPEPAAPTADDDEQTTAPRRRRRAGTTGAVSPSELVPTLLAPEPVAETESTTGEPTPDTEDDDDPDRPRRRRRGRRGRGPRGPEDEQQSGADEPTEAAPAGERTGAGTSDESKPDEDDDSAGGTRRRRRRKRSGSGGGADDGPDDDAAVVHVREPRQPRAPRTPKDGGGAADEDGVRGISGSTRMAAKRVRRQEGRDSGRRRTPILSEAEFLARREAVDRTMVVRQKGDRTQIAVLEDGVLVEHYVTRASAQSYAGNVYLGRVQNVLPSMEAAFVDIGKGRNAVLYAGEVNYAGGSSGRKIESVLKSGQEVLVQVSKDPIGSKGARLTGQVSLPGRYLVYVPEGSMTGISRKLPEPERDRLKAILKKVVPDDAGVIIRTAAEGASEEEIERDVRRLQAQWEVIKTKAEKCGGPVLLNAEPDLVVRVVRDVFNEDFAKLVVQGDSEWDTIRDYVEFVAPDLAPRLSRHASDKDVFAEHRIDEQLAKALDRKVWLPSGGSLVIDRTEAMVVIDVNTGKYVGKGGNLEETVTRNNLEAAEEIARQLRLRDLGGIIVVDFIDMVLESNRDLVVRRLVECLGRDRTKHQVAEVTSLGLVQMTRKRVGQGLLESFSEPCERCNGRGVLVSSDPVDARRSGGSGGGDGGERKGTDRGRGLQEVAKATIAAKDRSGTPATSAKTAAPVAAAPDSRTGDPASPDPATPDPASPDPATPGAEGEPAPRRRRRGGRGAGSATVSPSDEMAELLTGAVPPAADQPVPAQEDLPVLPPEVSSVTDPEPVDSAAAAAQTEAQSSPVLVPDDAPVSTEPALEPTGEPTTEPTPRRRRRATSRPAGPPVVA